jgi:hypothetical protein
MGYKTLFNRQKTSFLRPAYRGALYKIAVRFYCL